MISKMKDPKEGGTRIAIVFNGSPLFTGDAGSGESDIRRWIIENDWLEAIVALPDQLFYNTGIFTYVWIVTNRKRRERRGKVQLIDATRLLQEDAEEPGQQAQRNLRAASRRDHAPVRRLQGRRARSSIFDNEDFGYRRITVERPLRLSFAVTDERLVRVKESTLFAALAVSKKRKDTKAAQAEIEAGKNDQEAILGALRPLSSHGVVKNRTAFSDLVTQAFERADLKVPGALFKAILAALSERDETAEVCTDAKGNPEPDADLRDYENVPLKEDVGEYMRREVLPHVSDAWVDDSKTKIGYELNFNRYFYKYTPPRPLEEIEADLKKIEKEIADMLTEVTQ